MEPIVCEQHVNSFDIVTKEFKSISMDLIKEGINNENDAYEKMKQYFVNDKIFDECFKTCFNIAYITYKNNKINHENKIRKYN